MRSRLVTLALIAETGIVLWTLYVFYRWSAANSKPWNMFSDLVPYVGAFEHIVAPWVFISLFIPACFVVLAIAARLGSRSKSN